MVTVEMNKSLLEGLWAEEVLGLHGARTLVPLVAAQVVAVFLMCH
jgi:hypothetical protein